MHGERSIQGLVQRFTRMVEKAELLCMESVLYRAWSRDLKDGRES